MNTPIYDNKAIAELLAEDKWQLGDGKSPGRVGGNVLVRYLEHKADDITHEAWEKIELFYATWTSAKNYTNDSSPASNTVVDPLTAAGRSVEKGTFYRGPLRRQRVQGERGGGDPRWRIISTLFKGAADTEDFFTADDGCQYTVTRKYMIDQVATPTIPAKSSGVEASNNFQLDPESGLYNGYQEIRTRLYQQVPTFYTMNDAFSKAQRTKHLGVRTGDLDENGAAISPAIPDPTSQIAGVLVEVDRRKNSDCTQDIDVVTRTAIAAPNAITTDRKEKFESVTSDTDLNQPSVVAAPARSDGAIVTRENKKNETGLIDVSTTTRTAVPVAKAVESKVFTAFDNKVDVVDIHMVADPSLPVWQTAGTIIQMQDKLDDFGNHEVSTSTQRAVPYPTAVESKVYTAYESKTVVQDKHTVADPTLPSSQTPGTIVEKEDRITEFNDHDVTTTTRTAVAQTTATEGITHSQFETRTELTKRNTIDEALPVAQVAGTIVTTEDTINDFALHDVNIVTRTAVAVASAATSDVREKYQTVASLDAANQVNALTSGAQVAGTIVDDQSRLNDFGRYDTKRTTRTAVAVTDAETSIAHEAFENRAVAVDRNVAAPTPPSAQVAGTIVEQQDTVNEFDLHDVRETTRTAVPVNDTGGIDEREKFETRASTTKRNQDNEETGVALNETTGVITQVRSTLNEFLKWDTEKLERTAQTVTDATQEKTITLFETDTLNRDVHQNPATVALPVSQTPGAIQTVRKTLDEFGKETTDEEIKKATPVPTAVESKVYEKFENRVTIVDRHTVADPTLPSSLATPGVIVEKEDRLTEFNDHDVTTKTRTSVPFQTATEERTYSAFETRTEVLDRNTIADPTLKSSQETPGTVVTERDTVNEFGVHDIATITRVAVAADSGAYTSQNDAFKTVSAQEFHNAASIPSATTNQNVRGDKNELGKFDYSINTVTPVNASASNTSAVNAFQSVSTEVQHNAETLPDATANTSINGDKNELGKYDYTKRAVTPVNASASNTSAVNAFQSVSTEVQHNAETLPDATENTSINGDKNELGKYDYTKRTVTPTAATLGTVKQNAYYESEVTTSKVNQDSEEVEVTFAQGAVATVDNKLNELGKYDTVKKVVTPTARSQTAYVSNKTNYTDVTVTKLRNQSSAPPALTAEGESIEVVITDAQLYDSTKTVVTAKAGLVGGTAITWSIKGRYYNVEVYTTVSLTGPIFPYGPKQPIYNYSYHSSTVKMQRVKDYSMNFYSTEAFAYAAIHNKNENSDVSEVAPGVWRAVAVTDNDAVIGTVATYDDPWKDLVIWDKNGDGVPDPHA